jgi:DNA repair exonuclease SbcCD ATPase subunit
MKPTVFEIYQDGELLNQEAASKDYQEHLEKFILKLNYKSFTQIVILGSASFTPFMQLSASDRRAIIEDLLDIQIFSTMNSLLKEKLSTNKEQQSNNKHKVDLTNQSYNLQKEHIDSLKQDNAKRIEEYEKEINCSIHKVSSLHDEIEFFNGEVESHQRSIEHKIDAENKVKKINKIESQIENNLSKFQKDISFFADHDSCPTCKQSISLEFKTEKLHTLHSKVDECETGLKKLESLLITEQNKLNEVAVLQRKIQEVQLKIAQNNTTILETNKYIKKKQEEIEKLSGDKKNLQNETDKLNSLKKELEDLETNRKKLIDEKVYYETAALLLKDTGIKTKIIRQYLPIINKLVNKYLSSLDFFVNFNLDESFKETIKSRHRDDFSYHNFSEGEKQRIDMALMLTWRAVAKLKNSSNTNLLILDEIFDSSLDSNGTEDLMKILHMLEGVNLFVISHKGDVLQDKFANVIKFDKVKNFSRIMK